ncbi:ABC transporter permease [Siccationidurans ginsengisoli]|nr:MULTISPECIES: ABC transporter permease [unclassified Hymenobacter]MBO2033539.1 ABC transporter permease [Hymenobacter sp. BT559]
MLRQPERGPVLWHRTLEEAVSIGTDSVFIVGLVAFFIGAVTCVQIAYNMVNPLVPVSMVGYMVREMMILEMAPTITSIVLAGKVGSSIAGGLGTMRITEQISAMDVMGINSASYLVLPRVLAALFVFPLLVILAMSVGILGGYTASQAAGLMASNDYITGIRYDFVPYTVLFALIKSIVFAFLIASIAAYKGYTMRGGALEVGLAGTAAVTNSIIAVLLADYLMAALLL